MNARSYRMTCAAMLCLVACSPAGAGSARPAADSLASADAASPADLAVGKKEGRPSACEGLPERYGMMPHLPLAAGVGAGGGGYGFFGRDLFCADGATPQVSRNGSIGIPKGYEPRGDLVIGKELSLDSWSVRCGDKTAVTLYISMYRVGPRCPPPGFVFVPPDAAREYQAAGELLNSGKFNEALAAVDRAIASGGAMVTYLHRRGVTLLAMERFAEAESTLARAVAASRPSAYLRLHLGISMVAQGKREPYAAIVAALRKELAKDHDLSAELDCRHAINEHRSGRTQAVVALAASACKRGNKHCCTFPP